MWINQRQRSNDCCVKWRLNVGRCDKQSPSLNAITDNILLRSRAYAFSLHDTFQVTAMLVTWSMTEINANMTGGPVDASYLPMHQSFVHGELVTSTWCCRWLTASSDDWRSTQLPPRTDERRTLSHSAAAAPQITTNTLIILNKIIRNS